MHEKSILLASVPASLFLLSDPVYTRWFQILSIFTMYPLLKKDGLVIPYYACIGLYWALVEIYILLQSYDFHFVASSSSSTTSADTGFTAAKNEIRVTEKTLDKNLLQSNRYVEVFLNIMITLSYIGKFMFTRPLKRIFLPTYTLNSNDSITCS